MISKLSGVNIKAICCTVPRNVLRVASLGSIWSENEIRRVIKASGIEEIRIADEKTTAADLCVKAAENIFKELHLSKDSVDGIVFVTQTPDYIAPATSCILQSRLSVPNEVVAIDINHGCNGYIYGVFLSSMLVTSGSCKRVLLMAGDTISKLLSPYDRSLRTVLGDGGSATIVEKGEGDLSFRIRTDGKRYDSLIVPAGGMRVPHSEETCMSREMENGNYRSKEHLFMDGIEVMKFALSDVPILVEQLLSDVGWAKTDVGCYIFHQANKFIIDYVARKMKLNAMTVPVAVQKYGNTGPASIPLTLVQKFAENSSDHNALKKMVAVGFGVGFSWGAFTGDLSETQFLRVQEL